MSDEQRIAERVRARMLASEFVNVMTDELSQNNDSEETSVNSLHFWETLRDIATEMAPLPVEKAKAFEVDPLDDTEAERMGRNIVEFGKHAGKCYRDVPTDYLEWLADDSLRTTRMIRGYLGNANVSDSRNRS